jgi:perosamine synthetase
MNTPFKTSANKTIPLSTPSIRGNEWAYIKECLDTNWVSSAGAFVNRFESDFAAEIGCQHAIAVVNGTAALHLSLLAIGVKPGDEVLVSDLTFISPANTICYAGAKPVFVDASPHTWQMDPALIHTFLHDNCENRDGNIFNKLTGRRIAAILPVHILGHPVDMEPLIELAQAFGLPIIEDATESLGARYKNQTVGTLGDISCFSFNGNKLMTTGGGGMVVTDNPEMAAQVRHLSTQAKLDPIEQIHDEIGFNYRLTNIQAAMGCAQLERLDEHLTAKRQITKRYDAAFATLGGIEPMPRADWAESACWMYTIQISKNRFGVDRGELFKILKENGVETRPLWQPMHLSPAHQDATILGDGSISAGLYRECLSLPCSVELSIAQQDCVIELVMSAKRSADFIKSKTGEY